MAVALNNAVSFSGSSSGGTTVSSSYTASSGSNRVLLSQTRVLSGAAVVSGVTYAVAALTQITTSGNLLIWRKTAPATGANTISVSLASYNTALVSVADFTGVDQTTPLGTEVAATGTSAAPDTGSITCPSNGMVWGGTYQDYTVGGTLMTASGGTTLGGAVRASGQAKAGGYSSSTGSLSWTAPSSAAWEAAGVPLNAVSAGVAFLAAQLKPFTSSPRV